MKTYDAYEAAANRRLERDIEHFWLVAMEGRTVQYRRRDETRKWFESAPDERGTVLECQVTFPCRTLSCRFWHPGRYATPWNPMGILEAGE